MTRLSIVGLVVIVLLVCVAVFGPLVLSWDDVTRQDLLARLAAPSTAHPLGSDQLTMLFLGCHPSLSREMQIALRYSF